VSGDAVDEVSFMKISYVTYASFIKILKLHKFPVREAPLIQLIGFPELSSKLQD
jgi:hypothetical protein